MIKRYFYGDSIEGFLSTPESQIIGELTTAHTSLHSSLQGMQADAWREEIELLKNILSSYMVVGIYTLNIQFLEWDEELMSFC